MAIAKMRKLSIVAEPELKAALLRDLQNLQKVEVRDLPSELAEDELQLPQANSEAYAENFSWYERAEQALVDLSQYRQKESLKDKLTAKRPVMTMDQLYQEADLDKAEEVISRIESLKSRRTAIQDERETIETQQNELVNWRSLPVDPTTFADFEHFDAKLGKLPNDDNRQFWNTLQAAEGLSLAEVYSDENEIGVVLFIDKDQGDGLDGLLADNHFSEWEYPYQNGPDRAFQNLEKERKDLLDEEKHLVSDLQDLQGQRQTIALAAEVFYNQAQLQTVDDLTYDNDLLTLVSGWVTEEDYPDLQAIMTADYPSAVLLTEEISQSEIDNNEVPIKLNNNKLVEPFETVTEMYSLPKYNELDPTPYLTPFYILFFGMMMADLGYGLLMWLVTIFVLKVMDLKPGVKRFMRFGHILSYPTMIWGIIYGSIFGASLPIQLINPTEDVELVLILSIAFGAVQIFLGLMLKTYLASKEKDYDSAYSDGLGWLLLLLGIIVMVIGSMAMDNALMTNIGKWVAIIAAIGMVVVPMIFNDKKLLGAGLGLYNLYGIANYVGDFVSYTRLMALGVSSGSIALAFNMLIAFFPAPARFTIGLLILVFLHLFNMFLGLLSAYVHGARLIFVEFFGKFYEGGGRAFAPIKTLQDHVRLKDDK
ncbi:V-type ATP synthase subunit I [Aerococcus kribbianus]|uniref:V-type ATP synthase subunit I n=1 Tax=Aerococcus kribbianus TaxID=2999064 RepID=A0A9X3JF70_9LACT|nr:MULTISPECIES: V-type ATP synthase subunit I [unclassified Aerococcus]MCZ0717920.1 V-type ATP synthase subunit I [Aerococcus sp. YH-aer221]MCZ0726207.1 V-type ATP synthase subunit I [Aerococcus sp. YH-aer222]